MRFLRGRSGCGPAGSDAELERRVLAALRGTPRVGLVEWYARLAPNWVEVEPALRRHLMLRIHQWIAERVLAPVQSGASPAEDLRPGGALVRSLVAEIPPGQLTDWRGWIRLVVVELKRALRWPPAKRNEAWAHWLFLIPYIEQMRGRTPEACHETDPLVERAD